MTENVVRCRRCPRLVEWRERVARERTRRFADEEYWGKPVPGFGDPQARILVVGLAPAAHGANRTGRMFTGDRSGDFLFAALSRTGFANRPVSTSRDDGLTLTGVFITAAVRCAPPANRPTPEEKASCREFLVREIEILSGVRVFLALGGYGLTALLEALREAGTDLPKPRPRFAHGMRAVLPDGRVILASYHPSQQNTFTGRLTPGMLDEVLRDARSLAGL